MTAGKSVISLSKARKEKARATRRSQADANAVKFGRSKAERKRDAAETDRTSRALDQAKRDT